MAVEFTPIIREPHRSRAVGKAQRPSTGFEGEKAKLLRRIAELEEDVERADWKSIVAQNKLDNVSNDLEEVKHKLQDVNFELDDANRQLRKVTTKLGKMTLKSDRLALDKILLEKEIDILFAERDIFVSWQINCLVVRALSDFIWQQLSFRDKMDLEEVGIRSFQSLWGNFKNKKAPAHHLATVIYRGLDQAVRHYAEKFMHHKSSLSSRRHARAHPDILQCQLSEYLADFRDERFEGDGIVIDLFYHLQTEALHTAAKRM